MSPHVAHFRLPGLRADPYAPLKSLLGNAVAYSRFTNSRNVEDPWYIRWDSISHQLVYDIPNALVAPQFGLWLTPEDDSDGIAEDAPQNVGQSHDITTPQVGPSTSASANGHSVTGASIPPGQAQSASAITAAVRKARTRVPDFSILLVDGQQQDDLPLESGGIEVLDVIVGAIIEIKNYISRRVNRKDPSFKRKIATKVRNAQKDLLRQAAHLFINYPQQQDVIAIAAAGPHWTCAILERGHVINLMNAVRKEDRDYDSDEEAGARKPDWRQSALLGAGPSNTMFHKVHRLLKEKAAAGAERLTGVDILSSGRDKEAKGEGRAATVDKRRKVPVTEEEAPEEEEADAEEEGLRPKRKGLPQRRMSI